MSERFLIFALARSGSTTLARLLRCHEDIRCLGEPFHRTLHGGEYWRQARDQTSLDAALDRIWSANNAIKHVWHPEGWPFRDAGELNEYLLLKQGYKVLFLTRRNLLRRLVSLEVSDQTGIWSFESDDDKRAFQAFALQPLNIASLRSDLELERRVAARYWTLAQASGKESMRLYYEDFFADGLPPAGKLQRLDDVFAFLGRRRPTDPTASQRIERLFDPSRWMMNSQSTYRRIPGIDRIEAELGSNETGWLFDDSTKVALSL